MGSIYFIIWLACGGLATFVGFRLLKSAERCDDVEGEILWQYLLHPGGFNLNDRIFESRR